MFTGIIRALGRLDTVTETDGQDMVISISTELPVQNWKIGDSIACSGVCLTVIEKSGNVFKVQVSRETQERTTIPEWKQGQTINLEESLRMGDDLGGHLVTGHVDGVGKVESIVPDGSSHRVIFSVPQALAPFVAQKGSVAIDGISLTVNAVDANRFSVNIIPHTWDVTTFGGLKPGSMVNVEVDLFARYIARQLEFRA